MVAPDIKPFTRICINFDKQVVGELRARAPLGMIRDNPCRGATTFVATHRLRLCFTPGSRVAKCPSSQERRSEIDEFRNPMSGPAGGFSETA
jgi:hypothetical protein